MIFYHAFLLGDFLKVNTFLWSSDKVNQIENNLIGFIFSENDFIFSNNGLEEYLKINSGKNLFNSENGRFALTLLLDNQIIIKSDFFGQEIIYYYFDENECNWAISNSFYELANFVKRKNWKINLYLPSTALYLMPFDGLFSAQLQSHNSILDNIKILPLDKYLIIKNGNLIIKNKEKKIVNYNNYQELIEIFIQKAHDRMLAFSSLVDNNAVVDLSGGQDSRLVYGLCTKTHNLSTSVKVRSNKKMIDDFNVANIIINDYNINMGSIKFEGNKLNGFDEFELWKHANVGIYKPLYLPLTKSPRKLVQFDGANFLASAYLKKNPQDRLNFWRDQCKPKSFELIESEFKNSFLQINHDFSSTNAMEMHYLNYRARIHYGRSWYRNLCSIVHSPIMCTEFHNICSYGEILGYSKNKIMCDVIRVIDKKLIHYSFSNEKSRFSESDIEYSLLLLKDHQVIDKKIKVYGFIDSNINNDLYENKENFRDKNFFEITSEKLLKFSHKVSELDLFYSKDEIKKLSKNFSENSNPNDLLKVSSIVGTGLIIEEILNG
ncbi:hypothetical protein [Acinetobacter soli]|uniref:hypothetical protein n=1 Tax=Acinetobacter soli TaxID=487316 RepID=UPI001BAD9285|nr:hypothetical protein [Acinetobacter soli]